MIEPAESALRQDRGYRIMFELKSHKDVLQKCSSLCEKQRKLVRTRRGINEWRIS